MKLSLYRTSEKLIWLLTVFILTAYIIFETYTWGRYAYFGASVAVALLCAYLNKGRITIRLGAFHGFMLLFSGYCFLSSLWALDASNSTQMGKTVFQILVCAMMLYVYYQNEDSVQKLLDVVKWTGFIVSVYAIAFYGLDEIANAAEDVRLENDFSNVNTIGMAAAVSCMIQVHEWLYKQSRRSAIFMIPCVLMIAASQSRKALVLLALGVFGVYFIRRRKGGDIQNRLLKMALLLIAAFGAAALLYSLPIFDGIRERMDGLIAGLLGGDDADNSTLVRLKMIALGWEWFKKYPIGGIGIGNPHILAARYLGKDTYLHNNFAELLCGGGIFGFAVYYGMYFYLFRNLLKYKNADRKHFEICFVWLVMMLFLDYGRVSYYTKSQWFYLLVHFLNVSCLKKKSLVIKNAVEATCQGRN